jgi:hypothetical protein
VERKVRRRTNFERRIYASGWGFIS